MSTIAWNIISYLWVDKLPHSSFYISFLVKSVTRSLIEPVSLVDALSIYCLPQFLLLMLAILRLFNVPVTFCNRKCPSNFNSVHAYKYDFNDKFRHRIHPRGNRILPVTMRLSTIQTHFLVMAFELIKLSENVRPPLGIYILCLFIRNERICMASTNDKNLKSFLEIKAYIE